MLHVDPSSRLVRFGPIRRKTAQTEILAAPCICQAGGQLACAHLWATWIFSKVPEASSEVFLAVGYAQFIRELRQDLMALGVPAFEAQLVGSHAFRHGAARDLLEETGLRNTMLRGGWKGKGVFHYTPRAEVDAQAMAEVWEGLSEDEH